MFRPLTSSGWAEVVGPCWGRRTLESSGVKLTSRWLKQQGRLNCLHSDIKVGSLAGLLGIYGSAWWKMNEMSELVERFNSREAASSICVDFHSIHKEGSLPLPGQRQSSEEEENSGFICSIKQERLKYEQPSSLWWWDKMGIKIFSTINKCFFISYIEIKLFSIAVALQQNKWVNQWDVAEILIAIRLSGLQMASAFVCLVAPCVLTCMLNRDNNAMSA